MSSSEIEHSAGLDVVFKPAVLPCGRVVQNRLVKVALYEHLAAFSGGRPNPYHFRLYSEWAKHDWGIVLTGNVQVAPDHLSLGRDIVLPPDLNNPKEEDLLPFQQLAHVMHGGDLRPVSEENKTLAIMQLSHAGRQSSNFIGGRRAFQRPLAPSAIPVGLSSWRKATLTEGLLNNALFQTPKEMTEDDILNVVVRFVYSAVFAHKAGFDGIQLHAAHGYLLAQFLSPKTNKRTDAYSYDKALDLIHTIVTKIRALTPPEFVIGIKLNAADYTNSATGPDVSLTEHEQRAMQHLLTIARWATVDFVEISGGDYETPDFLSGNKQKSTRQAFFTRFSQQAIQTLSSASDISTRPLILLTGGLGTPGLLATALAVNHADLVGMGRAAIRSPDIPTILKSKMVSSGASPADRTPTSTPDDWEKPFACEPELKDSSYPLNWIWNLLKNVRVIGAGADVAWHTLAMRAIAFLPMTGSDGQPTTPPELNYNLSGMQCVIRMFFWKMSGDGNPT